MMRRFLAGLIALAAGPAVAALPVGADAPRFAGPAALAGEQVDFSLDAVLRNGPMVVYFYPAAYTPGCNVQAREFSLVSEQFRAAGAGIVGVSLDGIEQLARFSADPDYCGGKFAVVSDPAGRIAKAFDLRVSPGGADFRDTRGELIGHGFAERTTFVVGRDGRIAATISGLGPAENVRRALAVVRELGAQTAGR